MKYFVVIICIFFVGCFNSQINNFGKINKELKHTKIIYENNESKIIATYLDKINQDEFVISSNFDLNVTKVFLNNQQPILIQKINSKSLDESLILKNKWLYYTKIIFNKIHEIKELNIKIIINNEEITTNFKKDF